MVSVGLQSRRVRVRVLETSGIALALLWTCQAAAQCVPEPTQANGTTTCDGTDTDGVQVTTGGTRVIVSPDATVLGAGGPAVSVAIPTTGFSPVSINVAGRVDGGTAAGVALLAPTSYYYQYSPVLNLTVAAGAMVTGAQGLAVTLGNTSSASVAIDNAGTIAGTSGIALLADTASVGYYTGIYSITNRATGFIGAISGPVGTITNAGTIDGGSHSAIDPSGRNSYLSGDLTNSGTITNDSATAATIANLYSARTIRNSGIISNSGVGAALTGDTMHVNNAAGATIASAGSVALSASGWLNLVNAGTINGGVVVTSSSASNGTSRIDSAAGTINGDVLLGAGTDTLVAGYGAAGLITGITGSINGGAGIDTLRVRFAADQALATQIALPTNFERLTLAPEYGVTLTLADGFTAPAPLRIAGAGTIVNQTTLSGSGQVLIANDSETGGGLSFVNSGRLISGTTPVDTFGVYLLSIGRFENSGEVIAATDGVYFSSQGGFENSGSIVAGGTALRFSGPTFLNSGTIRSTAGVGAILSGSAGTNWHNTGRIEGATGGVRLSETLVNSGVITSPGTAVLFDFSGGIDNRAGGVITGGTRAIGSTYPNSLRSSVVANAGTINGDVVLFAPFNTYPNSNRFFALPGGVLNGNLSLGRGDMLIAELSGSDGGSFAGITGTVTGDGALLRYRVRGDANTAITVPSGFASVGYDLYDDASLTLTGGSNTLPITLAGMGTVDLTADITVVGASAISTTSRAFAPGETYIGNVLAITSRGALTLTRTELYTYPQAAAVIGPEDLFTNAGTITVIDRAPSTYNGIAAMTGGKQLTNAGSILLDGSVGVQNAPDIINSGTIAQIAGGSAATGVAGTFTTLTNSGSIDVAGAAVQIGFGGTIINSGRLASSGGAAIQTQTNGQVTITNLAGGVIAGAADGPAITVSGGVLSNAGTISGSVDLGFTTYGSRSWLGATYIANGGTIAGDLLFGEGNDVFIATGDDTGVSGAIDGGAGDDLFLRARDTSGTVTLGAAALAGFELQGVQANGATTTVTVLAETALDTDLYVRGDGAVVNTATILGSVVADQLYPELLTPAGFTNQGTIGGGFSGITRAFANSGAIGSASLPHAAVQIAAQGPMVFDNSGAIAGGDAVPAVQLFGYRGSTITATNSGSITGGGFDAHIDGYYYYNDAPTPPPAAISLANSGTINGNTAVTLGVTSFDGTAGSVTLDNSGTIESLGASGIGASLYAFGYDSGQGVALPTIVVTNSGAIRANGGGIEENAFTWPNTPPYVSVPVPSTSPAIALAISANSGATATVTNGATGIIEATGERSVAIVVSGAGLNLINDGTIRGGAGTVLASDDLLAGATGRPYLAGAVQTFGDGDDRIVNNGTILGSIDLGAGDDRIENYGRIEGDVFLGLGDDSFLQRAGAVLIGTVDAGDGIDSFIVDATGGGAVNGDQFVNFEQFSQIGEGNVTYSGAFRFDTIGVIGGELTVAEGQTLSSDGVVTVSGSAGNETVTNNGTVAGSVELAGGDDRFVNNGSVLGAVTLGEGDDRFTEMTGSSVVGTVDGGTGNDVYAVRLAGDRTGIGARTGFERLAVEGGGTLSLTLDQSFDSIALSGTGLNLQLGGYGVGVVAGSDASESLTVDGDLAQVALGGGNDQLTLGTARASGLYMGQGGSDVLQFTATGPVTLGGTATGFEQISVTSGALIVAGTLGSAGDTLTFGEGDQQLTLANGGTLAGMIDLGAGNDRFHLIAGGSINGVVSGGVGQDTVVLDLNDAMTLTGSTLRDFELLTTEGNGALTIAGDYAFDRVVAGGDLTVAANATLAAGQLGFAGSDDRITIAGRFVGAIDGGAGTDTLTLSGGTANAPVAFSNVANIEVLTQSGGFATLSGTGTFGSFALTGGRFVGLAGSRILAGQIDVGPGAFFGSAGEVVGNLAVAGTLSPGSSPGTMTVTGNVALAGSSRSLFELSAAVSDKLVVNGAVTIAPGATLELVASGTLRPGMSYDLITATGGITGSYTTVIKPDSLFGFLVQNADSIRLLGQFTSEESFSPQVHRSIDYANTALAVQPANSGLFAAVPALLIDGSTSDARAFARLTPEPYAAATQMGVDNALALTDAARGAAFATSQDQAGLFTFAQALGQWHRLGADRRAGSAAVDSHSYGFLGGIGFGSETAMVGAFGGYLNSRQQIDTLGARTKADGFVAGVHGRWNAANGIGVAASMLYDGGEARTDRTVPGAASAGGRYGLHSWVADISVSYALPIGSEWAARPKLGVTYVRTTRDALTETGDTPFALAVARDRHVAGFGDAALAFGRSDTSQARFRPFVSLGVRYQLEGTGTDARAGYAGADLGLVAIGPTRAKLLGTIASGLAYRVDPRLDLFASASSRVGTDDQQESLSGGIRLRF